MKQWLCLLLLLPLGLTATPAIGQSSESPQAKTAADPGAEEAAGSEPKTGEYHEAYRVMEELNAGLEPGSFDLDRQSPQSTLELFVDSVAEGNLDRAAHALNLNGFAPEEQPARGRQLAQYLYYVLDREVGIDWEGLPDRSDGFNDFLSAGTSANPQPPRRSLRIGTLKLGGRDVVLRLQRVKTPDAAPVWVISPQTLRHVPALYERYGPNWIDRQLPEWAKIQLFGTTPLWAWVGFVLLLLIGLLLAWQLRRWLKNRLKKYEEEWVVGLGKKIASPAAVLIGMAFVYTSCIVMLEMPGAVNLLILVALVLSITWLAMRAIAYLTEHIITDRVDDISDLAGDDYNQYQQWLTYLSVGRRLVILILVLIAAGVIVSQVRSLQALGISMIASAGVASVVLGIAAQPMLANVVAGAQIALTRPVRIGDSVLYEGSWGYIEDITYTYVLIQSWDQRRLIVPLRYFISKPFENWTMQSAHLTKPIYFHAHYTVDVDALRKKFDELLRASDEWDEEREPEVIVTKAGEETLELRAVCSAKDASTAWSLHCRLREEMVKYLRQLDGGRHLPTRRLQMVDEESTGSRRSRGQSTDDADQDDDLDVITGDHPGGREQGGDSGDGGEEA